MDIMLIGHRIYMLLVIMFLSGLVCQVSMYAAEPPKEDIHHALLGILPSAEEFEKLIDDTIQIFDGLNGEMPVEEHSSMQALNVPAGSRVSIVGDLHGDFQSLKEDYFGMRTKNLFKEEDYQLSDNTYLVFLGDFADRGFHGLEVWQLVMYLKLQNPRRVFIVRGNHENSEQAAKKKVDFVFYRELELKYPGHAERLFKKFMLLWSKLPQAVFIGLRNEKTRTNWYMLCCHAALEPCLTHKIIELLNQTTLAVSNTIMTLPFTDKDFAIPTIDGELESKLAFAYTYVGMPTSIFNGFNWSDIAMPGTAMKPGRSLGVLEFDIKPFLHLLHGSIDDWTWRVRCVMRGHGHREGGILKFGSNGFEPVTNKIPVPIVPGDIFMFMSAPEALPMLNLCEDAFGIVHLENSSWILIPYIAKIRSTAGCSRMRVSVAMQPEVMLRVLLYLLSQLGLQENNVGIVANMLVDGIYDGWISFASLFDMLKIIELRDEVIKLGRAIVPDWPTLEQEFTTIVLKDLALLKDLMGSMPI